MLRDLFYRLRALLRRGKLERELEEEMRHHAAATLRPATEAELEQTREACRDARGVGALESFARDLRLACRSLRHCPGFTLPAALTLALGLGAAVAIFAVAQAVLLKPLAYPNSGKLVLLRERLPAIIPGPIPVSAPDIPLLRAGGKSFDGVGAFQLEPLDLAGAGAAARVMAARVSSELFPLLGASPRLGHNFAATDDRPGQHVVLLSDALWRQRLGADPKAVGRVLRLEGQDYTVVGVMPPNFEFPPRGLPGEQPAELWVPMAFTPSELGDIADNFDNGVVARLNPGATLAAARAEMEVAQGRIRALWAGATGPLPETLRVEVVADPLREVAVGGARTLMDLLLGAAGLLLLMSCANVVNLYLVRTASRRHELALRAALGASRPRLVRQALTEAAVLALGAGALGAALA
ncbi:MAG: ABC transporter permease, partial [Terriglobales bacterium]